jgi:hypothetical protein
LIPLRGVQTSDEEEPNGADPLSQHLDEADEEDYKMLLEEAKDFLPIERSLRRRRQPESYNPLKEGKLAAERFRTMKVTELTAAFLDKSGSYLLTFCLMWNTL